MNVKEPWALTAARQAVAQKKREIRDHVATSLDPDTLASDKRKSDKAVADGERVLLTLEDEYERQEAVFTARRQIPPGGNRSTISFGADEPVYRPDESTSFFRDVINSRQDPMAQERLRRHQTATLDRLGIEERDVTSGSAPGGGGFVPPLYLGDQWAELPRPARPFANVVPTMPMPNVGLSVSVPKVQSGVTVAVQATENAAISETDIDTETVSANLVTIAGQNDVSLQVLERSYPGLDQIIYQDLVAAHDTLLDSQLLNGSGTSGQHLGIRNVSGAIAVSYSDGTPTAAELLPKLYDAIQQVATNRFRQPNVIVMHPRRAAWLGKELSASFPLFQQGSLMQAIGQQDGGFVSSFAGLRVVLDPSIPVNLGVATNEDVIAICYADDYILMEGGPQFVRFDDVLSGNLTVRLRLHSFSFFVPHRQAKSTALVGGTGLAGAAF